MILQITGSLDLFRNMRARAIYYLYYILLHSNRSRKGKERREKEKKKPQPGKADEHPAHTSRHRIMESRAQNSPTL